MRSFCLLLFRIVATSPVVATQVTHELLLRSQLFTQNGLTQPMATDPCVSGTNITSCVVCSTAKPCLYDVAADPVEANNLAADPANADRYCATIERSRQPHSFLTGCILPTFAHFFAVLR